jgi:hypothetical protein
MADRAVASIVGDKERERLRIQPLPGGKSLVKIRPMHFFICGKCRKTWSSGRLRLNIWSDSRSGPCLCFHLESRSPAEICIASVVIPSENEGSGFALKPRNQIPAEGGRFRFVISFLEHDNPRFTIYGSCSSRLLKPCFCLYFAPYPTRQHAGQSERSCRHSPDRSRGAVTREVH